MILQFLIIMKTLLKYVTVITSKQKVIVHFGLSSNITLVLCMMKENRVVILVSVVNHKGTIFDATGKQEIICYDFIKSGVYVKDKVYSKCCTGH
jgi:hypothetical protein